MTKFFFSEETPRSLALVRIGACLLFLFEFAVRWPHSVELYSSDGLPMPLFRATVFEPIAAGWTLTVILHTALLFTLLASALGWMTRPSLFAALLISAWLGLLDGPGTFKKYSVIGMHLMLLLSLSPCGKRWSIDAVLRSSAYEVETTAWPRRLIQLFVCSVYLGAAITKLRTPDFTSGDLIEFSLLDNQWGCTTLGFWLVEHREYLRLASVAAIAFEFTFPFLVWIPRLRWPMLIVAFAFHTTLGMALHLNIFSPLMMVALLAFVEERDWDRLRSIVKTGAAAFVRPDRDGTPSRLAKTRLSGPVYLSCLCICLMAAVSYHGTRDNHESITLLPADADQVETMLLEQKPAYEDYIHRFEIGNRVNGSHITGQSKQLRTGMTVHGMARLIDDHPELDLDWILIAADGREAGRISKLLKSNFAYATAGFKLTDEVPVGRCRLILMANGYEVARKTFELERHQ